MWGCHLFLIIPPSIQSQMQWTSPHAQTALGAGDTNITGRCPLRRTYQWREGDRITTGGGKSYDSVCVRVRVCIYLCVHIYHI